MKERRANMDKPRKAKPNESPSQKPARKQPDNRAEKRPERPDNRAVKPRDIKPNAIKKEPDENVLQLEGRNAVLEALNHDKPIDKVLVKKGEIEGVLRVIIAKAKDRGLVVSEVNKAKLDELSHSGNHQGVIALCPAKEYVEVEDILERAAQLGEEPFILILEGITDTHNFGAIIRSAEGSGVHGIIIPKHRAAGLSGIVSKTSAGALEHMLISKVTNISRVIEELKQKGLWIACADLKGEAYSSAPLDGAIAIVIGDEGEGVSRLTKEKCDFSVRIPMRGKVSSLNASVAAGILMFEAARRRNG